MRTSFVALPGSNSDTYLAPKPLNAECDAAIGRTLSTALDPAAPVNANPTIPGGASLRRRRSTSPPLHDAAMILAAPGSAKSARGNCRTIADRAGRRARTPQAHVEEHRVVLPAKSMSRSSD